MGWFKFIVIPLTAARARKPAGDSFHQLVIIDGHLDNRVQLNTLFFQHFLKCLSLRNIAREAIENKAVLAVWLIKAVSNHLDCDLIGNQRTGLQNGLYLFTKSCSIFNVIAENIPRSNVHDIILLCKNTRLRTFTGAGGAKDASARQADHRLKKLQEEAAVRASVKVIKV